MDLSLGGRPDVDVVKVVTANWAAFYTHLGRAPGCELSVGPHLSWLLTGVPDPFLNPVFRTDLPADHAGEIVDAALRHFRARRVTRLSWWVEAAASRAGRHLASRGLTFDAGGTAMAADLRSVPDLGPAPAGLEIVPVESRALRPWVAVMRAGFGLPEAAEPRLAEVFGAVALEPPMFTYLGILDGTPVATSQLFLGAGVAGIYHVACLPEARGRGIGGAITRAPMLEARRLGYAVGILQASDLGYPVYRRLGFRDYGRLGSYQLRAEDSATSS